MHILVCVCLKKKRKLIACQLKVPCIIREIIKKKNYILIRESLKPTIYNTNLLFYGKIIMEINKLFF